MQSDCRTGRELLNAWAKLQETGKQACTYLERNLEFALSKSVESMGEGKVDGSARRQVVAQLQGLQKCVLKKALKDYPDQTARPVLHNPQLDKVSSSFTQALPGPETYIPFPAFSEAICSYICVPSPACRDLVGQSIGNSTVDIWGDRVQSVKGLKGDTHRHKHDTLKLKIFTLANECHLPATCEVFGAFASCIPQAGLSRIERGTQLDHPLGGDPGAGRATGGGNPAAGKVATLGELKTSTFCPSYISASQQLVVKSHL